MYIWWIAVVKVQKYLWRRARSFCIGEFGKIYEKYLGRRSLVIP